MIDPHSDEQCKNAMGGTELMKFALYERLPQELLERFQIVVSRPRRLLEKPRLLWAHDLHTDPEMAFLKDPTLRDQYLKIVFVSDWQKEQFQTTLDLPPSRSMVLQNAIVPISAPPRSPTEKLRLIYASTPHRGLDILLPVFDKISQERGNVELDVFSSFDLYGWPERDEPFRRLFDFCREHPHINYHGTKPNQVVREAFTRAHILAFPSTWLETSCLVAIEAMSAGCLAVVPNLGALPETCANFAWMYPFHEDKNAHAQTFYHALNRAMDALWTEPVQRLLEPQKLYFNTFYDWQRRAGQWADFLLGLPG